MFVCVGIGCAGATFYLLRLAVRNPDVSWARKSNPEPWNEYKAKQYKVNKIKLFTYISNRINFVSELESARNPLVQTYKKTSVHSAHL